MGEYFGCGGEGAAYPSILDVWHERVHDLPGVAKRTSVSIPPSTILGEPGGEYCKVQ